ncbi:MAG: EFR1 family ferrodoxin [Clostridiales bacterium]|nr:EFR1 family ferrodoxin [Candidatus Crickella merdequi]
MKNVIYCFSGTGNCLNLAREIKEEIVALGGGETEIIMMRKEPVKLDATDADRVGFVFPCYAGGLPGGVAETISRIRIRQDAYTFGIVSYAAYMGCGLNDINKIHRLDYWGGVSHHCSCIWLFPHFMTMPMQSIEEAQERNKEKAKTFAKDIVGRKYKKTAPKMLPNKIESMAWLKGLQYKKGAKLQADPDKCIGCGQCANLCPRDNIVVEDNSVFFGDHCINCLGCLQYCPQEAISMGGLTLKRERYHNPAVTAEDLMNEQN